MESDKLPKVTTKDEEKVIEAKVVEVLESVSLINTRDLPREPIGVVLPENLPHPDLRFTGIQQ